MVTITCLERPPEPLQRRIGVTLKGRNCCELDAVFRCVVAGRDPLTGISFGLRREDLRAGRIATLVQGVGVAQPHSLPSPQPIGGRPLDQRRQVRLEVRVVCQIKGVGTVAEEPPFHGEDEAELRACANGLLDVVSDPYAAIDGSPVKDPGGYRVESPVFRYGPLPAGNVLGLPPGTQSDAVAAGYVLVLPPFSAGVHRITVRANVADFGIAVDTEFVITVASPGKG